MSLNLALHDAHPADIDTDCVIAAVFEDGSLSAAAAALDERSGGRIARRVRSGDASGKAGRTALLFEVTGMRAPRLLLVGAGAPGALDPGRYLKVLGDAFRALRGGPVRRLHCTLSQLGVAGRDGAWTLRQAVLAAEHVNYRYTVTRKEGNGDPLAELTLPADGSLTPVLEQARGIAEGVRVARELGNLPPNICNPAYVADRAERFAGRHPGVRCEVLGRDDMQALGMGSLLAVARGSANEPKLVVLEHRAGGDARPLVLVGKGITFDSGGLNLKVQGGIEEMKFDMCGAATVLGTFVAAVEAQLAVNLVAIVACVENMPDGDAYRPSDVLTSMSGKTIEVLNTDAEGRLVLCDALTYAQRFEPAALVDVATLTGACVVALGKHASGLMSRDDELAAELLAAGETSGDRAWRLPLWDDYQSGLESVFADVANIGSKWGGAITAGCFLSRFTEGQRWAHLDIAGSAWDEGRKGMANGRPVGLLTQWLLDRCAPTST
jgi:leucyl aminopeptidase